MSKFFSWVASWFRSTTPAPVNEPKVPYPIFSLHITSDGHLFMDGEWPKPSNETEASEMINRMANALFLLGNGNLYALIQQAVANAGNETGDEGISIRLLDQMNGYMMQQPSLVVPPQQALQVPK